MKTTKTKTARKGFVITREVTSGGYCHVNLFFVRPDTYDGTTPKYTDLRLRWQATDLSHDRSDWYGFHAHCETDSIERMASEGKFAAQLERAMVGEANGPADWVEKLQSMGFVRYVQDRRVSPALVEFDRVYPLDMKKWVPSYVRLGWDSVHISCIARDETTAQSMILQELATHGGEYGCNPQSVKRCKEYLDAGMPVQLASYAEAPDMTSAADLLASPKARAEKLVASELAMAS